MSKKSLRLQMAKLLLKFATIETAEGILYLEGELGEGSELFIEEEDGTMTPVPDGEYHVDNKVITVSEGKVTSIVENNDIPAEENFEETAPTTNYDEAIMTLVNEVEALRGELDALKAEYAGNIDALKAEIEAIKSAATSSTAEEEFSAQEAKKPVWQKL